MARALIPLAEGFEELEAVTIIDLLRRAKVEVIVAGVQQMLVTGSRDTRLVADKLLDEVLQEAFDLVVMPGGLPGADHLNADERVHQLINHQLAAQRYVAAICAAPKVLVKHTYMEGRTLTSFPHAVSSEQARQYQLTLSEKPVVQDGLVITSRGPGTAMDFALHLIELLQGSNIRQQVEAGLQRA